MSAFKFRLQQVLDLREQHEKQTAAKLADPVKPRRGRPPKENDDGSTG